MDFHSIAVGLDFAAIQKMQFFRFCCERLSLSILIPHRKHDRPRGRKANILGATIVGGHGTTATQAAGELGGDGTTSRDAP